MEIVVWAVAGIFAANILVVAAYLLYEAVQRFRAWREIRLLEALWRIEPHHAARARQPSVRRRGGGTLTAAPPVVPPRGRRGHAGRTVVALGAAAALALGGLSVVGIEARDAVGSAVGVVVRGLDLLPGPLAGAAANDAGRGRGGRPERDRAAGAAPSVGGDPATTQVGTSAPPGSLPEIVAAAPASSTEIQLVWADVPVAIGYEIDRSEDGLDDWITVAETDENVTSYVDRGLSGGTTYYYRVSALTPSGPTPPSGVIPVTTAADLAAPADLAVPTVTTSSVELAWTDVDGESGYRIERSEDGVSGWTRVAALGPNVTRYVDPDLSSGTTYHYRVIARRGTTESAPSSVVVVTTGLVAQPSTEPAGPDDAVPAAPPDAGPDAIEAAAPEDEAQVAAAPKDEAQVAAAPEDEA